jgi:hypothetical protein
MDIQLNMPQLREVRFHRGNFRAHAQLFPPMVDLLQLDLEPLRWQNLTYTHPNIRSLPSLASKLIHLTSFKVALLIPSLKMLLVHVNQILQLKRLEISLFMSVEPPLEEDIFKAATILPNPRIRFLKFGTMNLGTMDDSRHSSEALVTIPDALIKAMPALAELVLWVTFYLDFPEFYDWTKLTCLTKLSLTIARRLPLDHHYILPASLQSLQLHSTPDIWTQFSSSSVTGLYVSRIHISNNPVIALKAENWPSILSFSGYSAHIAGQYRNYPHLNQLELKLEPSTIDDHWFNRFDSTRFCHELATDPAQLPSLESLHLEGLPQWDILLIMLKRRNVATVQGVRPLKALGIRAMYPKELTGPISSLLQGRVTNMPSLYEVSIHAAVEMIGNTSMYVISIRRQLDSN